MRRPVGFLVFGILLVPIVAMGAGIFFPQDYHDSFHSVRVAQLDPRVAEKAQLLDSLISGLVPSTLQRVEAAFGESSGPQPDSTYAMPIYQKRTVGLGGFGLAGGKQHTEFYPVDAAGGLQVWYHVDSITVATTVVFLRVDAQFLPLSRSTQNMLGKRLSWDQRRLDSLLELVRRQSGG
jgi:hypothetical protein